MLRIFRLSRTRSSGSQSLASQRNLSWCRYLLKVSAIVVRLPKPYHGLYYCLFTDRFYTSVTLAHYLLEKCQTRICGTAMTNIKLFWKSLIVKKMDGGTSNIVFNGSVAVAVWCDKRPTYFVATKYIDSPEVSVLRNSAQQQNRVPVTCSKKAQIIQQLYGRNALKWPSNNVV